MDPVTACALAVAAIFNYATEVRKTMAPEHRAEHDANMLRFATVWQDLAEKLGAIHP